MTRSTAFRVVEDFEAALAEYTGAPYVVTCDSCTNAIFLALLWCRHRWPESVGEEVVLPRLTYVGVAQAVRNAGYRIGWAHWPWQGKYRLSPTPIIDAAKRFTSGMYEPGSLMCVSFQRGKILAVGRGGAILLDDAEAAAWLRRARFDGRTPGDDTAPITTPAFHMYMDPPTAAMGLWALTWLPEHNADLPTDEYSDLSQEAAFR